MLSVRNRFVKKEAAPPVMGGDAADGVGRRAVKPALDGHNPGGRDLRPIDHRLSAAGTGSAPHQV